MLNRGRSDLDEDDEDEIFDGEDDTDDGPVTPKPQESIRCLAMRIKCSNQARSLMIKLATLDQKAHRPYRRDPLKGQRERRRRAIKTLHRTQAKELG